MTVDVPSYLPLSFFFVLFAASVVAIPMEAREGEPAVSTYREPEAERPFQEQRGKDERSIYLQEGDSSPLVKENEVESNTRGVEEFNGHDGRAYFSSSPQKSLRYRSMGGKARSKKERQPTDLNSDGIEGWNYLTTGDACYLKSQQALAPFRVVPETLEEGEQDERVFTKDGKNKIGVVPREEGNIDTSHDILVIKKEFMGAMEAFYGEEVIELIFPNEQREVFLENEEPLTVSEAAHFIAMADSIGEEMRDLIKTYPQVSEDLAKAIEEYGTLDEEASLATENSRAVGMPTEHLINGIWYSTTTALSSAGAVSLVVILLPLHHGVPVFMGLSSLISAFVIDPINAHRMTAVFNIPETYRKTKEAFASYSTSREALKTMHEKTVLAQKALGTARDLLNQHPALEKSIAPTISSKLKAKIEAADIGKPLVAVKNKIKEFNTRVTQKEEEAANKRQRERDEQAAARAAAERMDQRRLRFPL